MILFFIDRMQEVSSSTWIPHTSRIHVLSRKSKEIFYVVYFLLSIVDERKKS